MNGGVFIPFAAVPGFSPAFQAEMSEFVQSQLGTSVDEGELPPAAMLDDSEQPADLSVAQARKFLDRVSDKVRATIRVIAEADATGFRQTAVMEALGADDPGSLRSVWGGITKRTRTVLGDGEAYLIWWVEQDDDWVGRVSPMTHRSLRIALGL